MRDDAHPDRGSGAGVEAGRVEQAAQGRAESVGGLVDFGELFAGLPTAYLVMSPELVIVEANEAYCLLLGHRREDLLGRPVFEVFPPTPEALDERGRNPLQVSFEIARDTGLPDAMPLYKYDVVDPASGQMAERYWSLISAPLLADDGSTRLVLQRVQDVTDYVHEREDARREAESGLERVEAVEADLYLRVQQLRESQERSRTVATRLAAVNEVALALSTSDSLADLEQVVIGRGVGVLGADGGAVVSAAPDGGWQITLGGSIGQALATRDAKVPYDSPLPGCEVARTGRMLLLPTVADGTAHTEVMSEVYARTGRRAWTVLPLLVKGRCLGSLSVSWTDERHLLPDLLELLEGFAAQCAQALHRIEARDSERRAAATARSMSETLQRSLLTAPVQPDHLQTAVRYLPAADDAQIGGDWYDAFTTSAGATLLVVGDVSGHDKDAAATMGQVRNLLRGIAYAVGEPPAQVLSQLDQAVHDLNVGALATCVLAQVEQDRAARERGERVLRWSNAGHPPPLLVRPDGQVELLATEPDLLLGIDPGTDRHDHELLLAPGATVLFYTDGLVERRDASIEDGLTWLVDTVRAAPGLDLEALCDHLLGQLEGQVEDDVAVLAVRAHPEDRPRPA